MLNDRLSSVILDRCDALACCTERDGTVMRTFLSPAMDECHRLVRTWMQSAGMTVEIDSIGNIRGFYDGLLPEAPRLLIASHLDTVPNAGKYDGILGVMLGLACVEWLDGNRLPFAIDLVGFSDEEGVRYGVPFLGSRALVNKFNPSWHKLVDARGISLEETLRSFQITNTALISASLPPRTVAYLEFHIEQGPVLEHADLPLAVVESITGQSRATLSFHGRAGHAGTTPMNMRQDALMAAAEWLLIVENTAQTTAGLVASTGRIICEPGATNIIPDMVSCSLDVRSAEDEVRRNFIQSMLGRAKAIGARRRIEVGFTLESDQPTVALHPSLTLLGERAIAQTGVPAKRMTSGAGHDAMIMASHLAACMIFLRSPGGISHHPDEAVLAGDVATALQAGINFLRGFMQWFESEDKVCTL